MTIVALRYICFFFPLWMKAAMNQYADPFLSLPECSENILELFVGGRLLTRHGAVAQAHLKGSISRDMAKQSLLIHNLLWHVLIIPRDKNSPSSLFIHHMAHYYYYHHQ